MVMFLVQALDHVASYDDYDLMSSVTPRSASGSWPLAVDSGQGGVGGWLQTSLMWRTL